VCRTGCDSTVACPLNQYCDTTTATCAAGCDGSNARCANGQSCVQCASNCTSAYFCSAEWCANTGACEGSNYECVDDGSDSWCRVSCSTNSNCASKHYCVAFAIDNGGGPEANGQSFCAKDCTTDSDCSGTEEDYNPSFQTPCVCGPGGTCLFGDGDGGVAAGNYQCYAMSPNWGM